MISYIALIASVVVGCIIALTLGKHKAITLKFVLVFSGAYLLSLGVFHLLPEIYHGHDHHIGLWVMGGFFIQLVLEVFSKGVEHGHGHSEHFKGKGVPMGVMLGLFAHAFIESLPIGLHQHDNSSLLWGIVIHKLPVSVILFSMLMELTANRLKQFFWMALFAAIAPLALAVGAFFPVLTEYYRELTALTMGVFLHISTTILFESSQSHRFNFIKFFVTLLGVVIAWFGSAH